MPKMPRRDPRKKVEGKKTIYRDGKLKKRKSDIALVSRVMGDYLARFGEDFISDLSLQGNRTQA